MTSQHSACGFISVRLCVASGCRVTALPACHSSSSAEIDCSWSLAKHFDITIGPASICLLNARPMHSKRASTAHLVHFQAPYQYGNLLLELFKKNEANSVNPRLVRISPCSKWRTQRHRAYPNLMVIDHRYDDILSSHVFTC